MIIPSDREALIMKFCEIIRALRDDTEPHITQSELAKALNSTQRKISYLETGAAEPSLEDIRLLCKFYGVSADYLLGLPDDLDYPKR